MLRLADLFRRRTAPVAAAAPADEAPGWYWLQHPMVRERVNRLISGSPGLDAYEHLGSFLEENGVARPLSRVVVVGCGSGNLERDLLGRGLVGEVEAADAAAEAIAAVPEGRADAVFTHSALGRVERLEELFAGMHRALKPDGLLHLHEFVGPSRFQWTDAQLAAINGFLDTLPERLRRTPGGRKPAVKRPDVAHEPAQAVRSAEIRDVLAREFELVEERAFGGTLLHMGLDGIAQNFRVEDPEDLAHLRRFFELEDRMIREGAIGSDFAVLTARPAAVGGARTLVSVPFGAAPTRLLRPPAGFEFPGLDLTVSKADTMMGTSDAHYLDVGMTALAAIERALGGRTPGSILDLPCGFGRVTRVLRARYPGASITVSDLDRPGVDFSARQFGARGAYSVRDFRELDLGERYDLIWVGSLMTHLPAETTRRLFAALARHLTPGGAALITLQGPSTIPRMIETGYGLPAGMGALVVEEYERGGFGYRDYVGGEDVYGVSLTNEHYGISLTDERWMQAALAACGLRMDGYEARAWDHHHDVAVARLG